MNIHTCFGDIFNFLEINALFTITTTFVLYEGDSLLFIYGNITAYYIYKQNKKIEINDDVCIYIVTTGLCVYSFHIA